MENKNIKDILKEYQYSKKFRVYSNKYEIGNSFFANINSNEDVKKIKERTENTIKYYKTIYPLDMEDIEEVEKEIGKYEIAMAKIIQCYDINRCNFKYTSDELMELINNLDKYEKEVSNIRMKKCCQD